ncbi:MAG: hypothetical protein OXQ29_13670 [Rhodospirillaceae bacterium]|nr:hypothetical protein [Rhodospirillaceae bacterium]
MRRRNVLPSAVALLASLGAQGLLADDIRIVNANIVTMDDENPTADTLLIGGNRIVSVGAEVADGAAQTQSTAGAITVIDAQGAIVIPGLIDQHLH